MPRNRKTPSVEQTILKFGTYGLLTVHIWCKILGHPDICSNLQVLTMVKVLGPLVISLQWHSHLADWVRLVQIVLCVFAGYYKLSLLHVSSLPSSAGSPSPQLW